MTSRVWCGWIWVGQMFCLVWLLICQFYKASVIQLYVYLISCCLSTSMQISLVKPLTMLPPTSNLSVLQSVKYLFTARHFIMLHWLRCGPFLLKWPRSYNHHKMHRTSIVNNKWWWGAMRSLPERQDMSICHHRKWLLHVRHCLLLLLIASFLAS